MSLGYHPKTGWIGKTFIYLLCWLCLLSTLSAISDFGTHQRLIRQYCMKTFYRWQLLWVITFLHLGSDVDKDHKLVKWLVQN